MRGDYHIIFCVKYNNKYISALVKSSSIFIFKFILACLNTYNARDFIIFIFPHLPKLQAHLYKFILVCLNTYNARDFYNIYISALLISQACLV